MKIAIGADHAGFALKEYLRERLAKEGYEVDDLGTHSDASVDYPDYASAVAHQVASGAADRGVLVCYTGVGMSIAANKVDGIRAALAVNPDEIALTRQHNNANVVTFSAKFTPPEDAARMLDIFLTTDFTGGRHARRVDKIMSLEREKHD
jgi:ribose 5-phosphate isomerase B